MYSPYETLLQLSQEKHQRGIYLLSPPQNLLTSSECNEATKGRSYSTLTKTQLKRDSVITEFHSTLNSPQFAFNLSISVTYKTTKTFKCNLFYLSLKHKNKNLQKFLKFNLVMIIGLNRMQNKFLFRNASYFCLTIQKTKTVGESWGWETPQNMLGALRILPWYPYLLRLILKEKEKKPQMIFCSSGCQ